MGKGGEEGEGGAILVHPTLSIDGGRSTVPGRLSLHGSFVTLRAAADSCRPMEVQSKSACEPVCHTAATTPRRATRAGRTRRAKETVLRRRPTWHLLGSQPKSKKPASQPADPPIHHPGKTHAPSPALDSRKRSRQHKRQQRWLKKQQNPRTRRRKTALKRRRRRRKTKGPARLVTG